jgi:molecular chaperone GrpE
MSEKNKRNKEKELLETDGEKDIEETEESEPVDEVGKLKKELADLKNSYLRKAAEFENYKRRIDGEISNYIKYASENLIKELLPVYDDINRSVDSIKKGETKDFETLKTGIIQIQEKFGKILEDEGLKEIDCLGKEFNVDTSDALMQVERDDVKPHTVVDVIDKGYYLKDKVLRHSKVIVSSEKKERDSDKDEE